MKVINNEAQRCIALPWQAFPNVLLPQLEMMGFARQLKRMSHPTRWGTALIFVLAMAATLFSAIFLERLTKWPTSMVAMIIVICIVVQTLAMFWYALSYIPYGRRMFKACCVSVMSDGE